MELPFTHKPGRRERHLRRRHENPLFAWPPCPVEPEELLAAQREDHEEMEAFRESFGVLVERAATLPADTGGDPILEIGAALERHYEQACGLPEDQGATRAAIRRLLGTVDRAIWRAAGDDPVAHQESSDAASARTLHFRLLEQPLVADLLHPRTPIQPAELVPALLSATLAEVEAATEIFDGEQLALLCEQAETLLERLDRHIARPAGVDERLAVLKRRLEQYEPDHPLRQPPPI